MEGVKQDLIQDLIDLLGRIPIFDGLSIDECRRVMSIGEPVKYPTGSTIYQTNSPGSQILVILLGKVSIQTPEGLEVAQVEKETNSAEDDQVAQSDDPSTESEDPP